MATHSKIEICHKTTEITIMQGNREILHNLLTTSATAGEVILMINLSISAPWEVGSSLQYDNLDMASRVLSISSVFVQF